MKFIKLQLWTILESQKNQIILTSDRLLSINFKAHSKPLSVNVFLVIKLLLVKQFFRRIIDCGLIILLFFMVHIVVWHFMAKIYYTLFLMCAHGRYQKRRHFTGLRSSLNSFKLDNWYAIKFKRCFCSGRSETRANCVSLSSTSAIVGSSCCEV